MTSRANCARHGLCEQRQIQAMYIIYYALNYITCSWRGAHQQLLVMRLTAIFLLIGSMHLSAASYSQTITLEAKEYSLREVFESIQRQTKYNVVYNVRFVEQAKPVFLQANKIPIEDFLADVMGKQALVYEIRENTILIGAKEKPNKLPIVQLKPRVQAPQEHIVTGKVTDDAGEPLTGVSVMIKDKVLLGTSTDLNGRYVLEVPTKGAVVTFSMVGFTTQEIEVGSQSEINVVLETSTSQLDDVVVVGFGTQKRQDMIGSVVSVKPSDLHVPSSNLTTALAGRIAGMIAYQRSGEPGEDNAQFFIRGITSFGHSNNPLILIDNIEATTTDLARLQVDDIESFSVMKDATATAIYGARGANGVILITTKRGIEGRANVTFRLENSLSTATQNLNLADPITYMRLHNEAVLTRDPLGMVPYTDKKIDNTEDGVDPIGYPATDWRSALIKDYTMNQRAHLSVRGGGSVANYFVSGAFNQDHGILKVDKNSNFNNNVNLKTYSLRANVGINLSRTTELLVRLNGNFDDYNGPINGGSQVYEDVMNTNPVLFAPYYEPGEKYKFVQHTMFGNAGDGNYLNPYAEMVRGYKHYNRSVMQAQMEFKKNLSIITEGLNFRAMLNTDRRAYFDVTRAYNPFYYRRLNMESGVGSDYVLQLLNEQSGSETLSYAPGDKVVNSTFYLESAVNYNRTFNDKHAISGLLVYIMRSSLDGNAGTLQTSLPYRNLGLSARSTYSYDGRYFAEFNFGYNGSERFYLANRWGFFPSAGIAWSVSNEGFWEPMKDVVNNLRVRATYGLVGNDNIGPAETRFFYLSEVDPNNSARARAFGLDRDYVRNGVAVTRYPNPDITWEVAYKSNLALEIGLLDKVQIMADVFKERRTNILMARADIPIQMGLGATVLANVGEATSQGVDFSMDVTHSTTNGFWIQGRGTFTYATSEYNVYEEPEYDEPWRSRLGYPLNQMQGYMAERLFIDDEEVANSPPQFGEVRGGDIKYLDVNQDGKITEADQVFMGFPRSPEIVYGFGFSAGKGQFDVSAFFQGMARSSFMISPSATAPFGGERQLIDAVAESHWSEDNRDLYAFWPRLSVGSTTNNSQPSTWWLRNAAFLRLKQAEIGYNFSDRLNTKYNLTGLRVYLSGTNLFMLHRSFDLWDVEQAGDNPFGYPLQRVFNLGVQVSF